MKNLFGFVCPATIFVTLLFLVVRSLRTLSSRKDIGTVPESVDLGLFDPLTTK